MNQNIKKSAKIICIGVCFFSVLHAMTPETAPFFQSTMTSEEFKELTLRYYNAVDVHSPQHWHAKNYARKVIGCKFFWQ